MEKIKVMSRWKASFIHLTISAAIALVVLALMLLVWYPYPLFAAVGGQQILMILLGVDVTLGPLTTLTIFNLKNKSLRALKFDLSVIAALQITALIYGMSVVYQARPVFMVFSKDSFDLVTANMLDRDDLEKTLNPKFNSLPTTGPVYAYTEMPTVTEDRNTVVMSALSGKDLGQFPQYYKPFHEHTKQTRLAAKPLADLKALNPGKVNEIDSIIWESGLSETMIGYLPLRAKLEHMTVLVNKGSGLPIGIKRLNPWPTTKLNDAR